MRIHILTDNRTTKRGIVAEHGLSLFIEHERMNILFDTGQSDVYRINADSMGLDLRTTDCVVLSHGHYDHCGGLVHFPLCDDWPDVYTHKDALNNKYGLNPDGRTYRKIGIPWSLDDLGSIRDHVVLSGKYTSLAPGIDLIGEVPYVTTFEPVNPHLHIGDAMSKSPDMMKDEQMLVVTGGRGLTVFLGCSHPGVINCMKHALSIFPDQRIDTLIAGMHLRQAGEERLDATISHILDLGIRRVIPLHCTGVLAIAKMKSCLGDRCLVLCAGDSLEL